MSKKLTTKEFQQRLDNIYGENRFDVLSEYINNETKIEVKCNLCGSRIFKVPVKMTGVAREGCYVCSGKNKHKTTESFSKEVDEKYPQRYSLIGKYIAARTPLMVRNNDCGHEYAISPDNLLRGKGCPKCSIKQSSYMDIVEEILRKYGVVFIKEYTFCECKYKRKLPFDYFIPSMNCCIEVDGEFHYNETKGRFKNSNSSFREVQKRDNIKTNFCLHNGIHLIRLPYFEKENFEKILLKELYANTEITARSKELAAL